MFIIYVCARFRSNGFRMNTSCVRHDDAYIEEAAKGRKRIRERETRRCKRKKQLALLAASK